MPNEKFSWIPFYRELANAVLNYRNDRRFLLSLIYDNPKFSAQTTYLHMQDKSPAIDIDPFSFFAIFNRGIKKSVREEILQELKNIFSLEASVPSDFAGIPLLNNQRSFYFRWDNSEITKSTCDELWEFFASILSDNVDGNLFDKIIARRGIGIPMLTIAMFWIRPEDFLPLDKQTKKFLEENYKTTNDIENFSDYFSFIQSVKNKIQNNEIMEKSFPEISEEAYQITGNHTVTHAPHYYVVSPNFHDDIDKNIERKISFQIKNELIAIGHTAGPSSERFEKLNPGDRILCARRFKRQWTYYFAGIIESDIAPTQTIWKIPFSLSAREWEKAKSDLMTNEGWNEEEINDMYEFDSKTNHVLQKVLIQYRPLSKFKLADQSLDETLEKWSANRKLQIGTIERIKNENGENEEIIQAIENFLEKAEDTSLQPMNNMNPFESKILNQLRASKNLILTGAPGTGKTYLARKIAGAMGCSENEIGFVQFHPSYDYTDFVEGLRPTSCTNGSVGFERRDGIFKEFCKNALKNFLDSRKTREALQKEQSIQNKIDDFLTGAQETLKTLETKNGTKFTIEGVASDLILVEIPNNKITNRLSIPLSEISDLLKNEVPLQQVKDVRTYFGRKNNTQQDSYTFTICNEIRKLQDSSPINAETIPRKNFVFIIDEINRGEIAKIFGELFFSIDSGYRGEKGKVYTQYQNLVPDGDVFSKGFFVPENVYIIGTMNDIDRSVESMDFAMRRRFAWAEISPEDGIGMLETKIPEWKEEATKRMNSLNAAIANEPALGAAYQIGPAYFLNLEACTGKFDELWKLYIAGTLREYLRGVPDAKIILESLEAAYNCAVE